MSADSQVGSDGAVGVTQPGGTLLPSAEPSWYNVRVPVLPYSEERLQVRVRRRVVLPERTDVFAHTRRLCSGRKNCTFYVNNEMGSDSHSYTDPFRAHSVEINVFFYEFVNTCKGSFILKTKAKAIVPLIFVAAAVVLM